MNYPLYSYQSFEEAYCICLEGNFARSKFLQNVAMCIYKSTRRHTPEDRNLYRYRCDNFIFRAIYHQFSTHYVLKRAKVFKWHGKARI
jgi:hypothetical protein